MTDIEPGPDVSARLAWPDDADAIARLQIAAWRQAYPAAVETPEAAELSERWNALISRPPEAKVRVIVAVERADVRAFALVHPSSDPDADVRADAEIAELAVDPDQLGAGHGSRLMHAVADTLRADGFTRAVWWLDTTDDVRRRWATDAGWGTDGAHRELESDDGTRLKQVRLHTALA